ncbi:MAG: NAD-dependent succinate-semialdehyde dehydrogenase [Gammaproteobacteria bacterium]
MSSAESINPAMGETIRTYTTLAPKQIEAAIQSAHEAFSGWRDTTFGERARAMGKVAELLKVDGNRYARMMAKEMGKPIRQGEAEIRKCASVCDYYAENAERLLAPELVATEATRSFVACQPLGVILAVMPWNFPFWQVFRFAAPALMAGNAAVLKHAANVPACALAIESIFRMAGFPKYLFRTLLIESEAVGRVIEHPHIRAVTLTGSKEAGQAVASKAGAMLKKTVLELGGSDPYLILADADIERAAKICVESRLINSGQSCIAAKRFIVERAARDVFERKVVQLMQAKRLGDPLQEDTEVGPLARHDLRDALHAQVQDSIAQGARCLLGGRIPEGPGAYYPATVLTDVSPSMPAYEEELFGPVAAIIAAKDEEDAIRIANDTVFGLGASVFTSNSERGEAIALRLEAGCCFVNDFVRSDPRLPFGGIKQSGYGRELGTYGIKEFVNIKTIYHGNAS